MNKDLNNEKEQKLLKELRDQGKTVYSISRINSYNQCAFQYYNTYALKNRGIGNPYSTVGSTLHEYLEDYYRFDKTSTSDFSQKIHNSLMELEIMGLDFPSESIKESFVKDVIHYTNNFKKLDGEFILEKMFISKIGDNYLMGFIDGLRTSENKTDILDWKCSSKFSSKSKLQHAGRQLVIYKLGLEQTTGIEIDKIMWGMLKYINVCWVQANKKVKKKMINRGKLIKEMTSIFEKDMVKLGMDELEIGILLLSANESNSMEGLPQAIKEKYWLEDCFVEYEATEEVIKEVEEYVVSTIEEIESKDKTNESEWEAVNFEKDGTFYCNTLCNHRMDCSFIKEYNKNNKFKSKF